MSGDHWSRNKHSFRSGDRRQSRCRQIQVILILFEEKVHVPFSFPDFC